MSIHEHTDELTVVGGMVVSVALILKGDTVSGTALFTMLLGYVFGRVHKLNGELVKKK